MKNKIDFIKSLILIGFVVIMSSCNKNDEAKVDNKLDIKIDKIAIVGIGEFDFKDSLIYMAVDTINYKIKIITEPAGANIYYKTATSDFIKLDKDWILVDSTTKKLSFYSDLTGYNKTQIKSLDFYFNNDSVIKNLKVFPNLCSKELDFKFNSKTRGVLSFQIYDMMGMIKSSNDVFISTDTYYVITDLYGLSNGIYIVKLNYGGSKMTHKLVKQSK